MDASAWVTLSIAGLLSLLLVATAITVPLRRHGANFGPWGVFFSTIAHPLAVLLLSSLMLWVLHSFPSAFGHFFPELKYVESWYLLWVVILLFDLSEGIGRLYYVHVRRRPGDAGGGVLFFLGRLVVFGGAFLAIFYFALDLNASQLFTSTAVVAAVVGFALREVLGNLLAGISLNLAGTIQPAQWIAIGEKEGEVVQRNWREVRIRTTGGHIFVVPNSVVANSILHNMTWNSPLRRHTLDLMVVFTASPAVVRQAMVEAALSVPDVDLGEKKPDAWILAYKANGVVYRVRFWSRTFHDRTKIEGQVQERIWYRFQRLGIAIPHVLEVTLPPSGGQGVESQVLATSQSPVSPPVPSESNLVLLSGCGFVQRFLRGSRGEPLVDDAQLEAFAAMLTLRLYGPGEELFRQGSVGESCFILLQGVLYGRSELASFGEGGEFALKVGELVGELSVITGLPRSSTIYVREGEARVLEVPAAAFKHLLSWHPTIAETVSRLMAYRSRIMVVELQHLGALDRERGTMASSPDQVS